MGEGQEHKSVEHDAFEESLNRSSHCPTTAVGSSHLGHFEGMYVSKHNSGVYFIQAGENGPIKIGWSNDVRARMNVFKTCSPFPLRLLLVIPSGDPNLERQLHYRFEHERTHLEWFASGGDLSAFIAAQMSPVTPPEKCPRCQHERTIRAWHKYAPSLEDEAELAAWGKGFEWFVSHRHVHGQIITWRAARAAAAAHLEAFREARRAGGHVSSSNVVPAVASPLTISFGEDGERILRLKHAGGLDVRRVRDTMLWRGTLDVWQLVAVRFLDRRSEMLVLRPSSSSEGEREIVSGELHVRGRFEVVSRFDEVEIVDEEWEAFEAL